MNSTTQHSNFSAPMGRRSFLALAAGMAALAPVALTACGQTQSPSSSSTSTDSSSSYDIKGKKLTFVGDNAFAPYRYIEMQSDGSQKTVGLDIAIADEMASRLGFTYDFEPQEFAATLATIQSSDTSFTMAMSSNAERLETFDFTRGYYEPRVGVLTMGDKVEDIDGLKGKSIACTTGTVQNKFVTAVLPDADVHTYDGGDQCLQEVLAGRIDAYVCDGAEGQSMVDANPGLVLGLLDRSETESYVGVYRLMAQKDAPFVSALDSCIADMLQDGTIDSYISKYVGPDFVWGDGGFAAAVFWSGLLTTVEVTGAALVLAFALGAVIALLKVLPIRWLRALLDFYTSIFRGIPLIVLLFIAYFATPQLTGYKITMFAASVLTLGLNGSATVSETLRGGIQGVDQGQYDAARALGLPYRSTMVKIILPEALRSVAPALVNEVITVLKSSSLVATIGLADMMRAAESVQALTYRAFEPFIFVAVIYYIIVMILVHISKRLEKKLREAY